MKKLLLLFMLSVFYFSACERIEVDDTDQQSNIELTITKSQGLNQLTWTVANVSTFKNYIVVRSNEIIPNSFDSIISPATIIATINDYEENTFEDGGGLSQNYVYYKVFVDIGDRILVGNSARTRSNVEPLGFQVQDYAFNKESGHLFLTAQSSNKIHRINYKTGGHASFTSGAASSENSLNISKVNGSNKLLVSDQQAFKVYEFDPINFNKVHTFSLPATTIYSTAANNNGLMMASVRELNTATLIYTHGSSSNVGFRNDALYYRNRTIVSISDTENKFIEIENAAIHKYTLNNVGNVTSYTSKSVSSTAATNHIAVSEDGAYFVGDRTGKVYDKDLNLLGVLSASDATFYRGFAFSDDGTKLYALDYSNENVYTFKFPSLELERSFSIGFTTLEINFHEGNLIVLGYQFVNPIGFQYCYQAIEL